jgi:protein MAK11
MIPTLTSRPVVENPANRAVGSLLHHSTSITGLYFPSRGKLLSSAEDNAIAVIRTRDWEVLSTIKAPKPKAMGQPSGDTAPLGVAPSGINDFAVHPSMKLMVTVGRGEKCMRLWNLVTGKKAGVLSFERGMLGEVGEGRYSSGEGRKVAWGNTDAGEEFCVGFERGALVFGMDSKVRCKVVPDSKTKIHQMGYVQVNEEEDIQVLAMSTEDGRILFYSTRPADLTVAPTVDGKEAPLSSAKLIAQLGGKAVELTGRIKDYAILPIGEGASRELVIVTGGSDGAVTIWKTSVSDFALHSSKVKQVGTQLGTYATSTRVTCLKAFIMLPSKEDVNEEFEGFDGTGEEDGDSSSDSDSSDE